MQVQSCSYSPLFKCSDFIVYCAVLTIQLTVQQPEKETVVSYESNAYTPKVCAGYESFRRQTDILRTGRHLFYVNGIAQYFTAAIRTVGTLIFGDSILIALSNVLSCLMQDVKKTNQFIIATAIRQFSVI